MAVSLINSIANIPMSPDDGDIIRFSVAITSGIPNTVKKANGTTTETAIVVGAEYRYIGANWLKIGGDEIETTPLRNATTLDVSSEAADAILGAVHNAQASGRLRQFGFAVAHQALQAANPLSIGRVTLYDGNPSSGTNNLDIRTGSTRHNFTDDYFLIELLAEYSNQRNNHNAQKLIGAETWNASSSTDQIEAVYATGPLMKALMLPSIA